MKNNNLDEPKTIYRYNPNINEGLSSMQVHERIKNNLSNRTEADKSHSVKNIIKQNVFTYFNFIFFVFAVVLIIVGSYNNLTFLGVIFSNTIIGIVQEIRSQKTLSKLRLVSDPESVAVRDKKQVRVKNEDLVLDDIIVLKSGNQIPADACVCAGEVFVNESLVTGEADEIKKTAGDKLLSGSFVVSGQCCARLEAVGKNSFASKLAADAQKTKKRQRPGMMKSLNILIMVIGIIIIPFSVVMFINQYNALGLTAKESVENTVASAIGMIPEGLYLLTSVALAASALRLARKKTLVHDMKCIETLARVDVICVDKTGTITKPEMSVSEIEILKGGDETKNKIRDFVYNMQTQNPTQSAIKAYFAPGVQNIKKASAKREFSSAYKFAAAAFDDGAYVLGAPEIILKEKTDKYKSIIERYSKDAKRVVLFAKALDKENYSDMFENAKLCCNTEPLAFIVIENPIRENAAETFEYFKNQGVCVKVISGDSAKTASAAAMAAKIEGADKYIDVSNLSDAELSDKKILEYNVFGRVNPMQKRLIIRNLKKAKHTVAMTGDGVNDVLALKDADCSIAMASGSDAASSVADLVLVNSDFANMPQIVDEGRRVINNIERTASLFLVKNIFSFIMTVISLIAVAYYPLKPTQISLISCMMIGIPSFFLALEPNKNRVRGRFLTNVLYNAFPTALSAVIAVECVMIISKSFGIDYAQTSTVACVVYAFLAYMMLLKVCRPLNFAHSALFVLMGAGFVACVVLFSEFFNMCSLNIGCIMVMILVMIAAFPMHKGFEQSFEFVSGKLKRIKNKE